MSDYPRHWADQDLDGALASLTASTGVSVNHSSDGAGGLPPRINVTVDGRLCQFVEPRTGWRKHRVELIFAPPPGWPRLALGTAPVAVDPLDWPVADAPDGHTLHSPDAGTARRLLGLDFARASLYPPAALRIDDPESAILSGVGVRLNPGSVEWLLGLLRPVLAAVPVEDGPTD